MGISPMVSNCECSPTYSYTPSPQTPNPQTPNPDPTDFVVLRIHEVRGWTVAEVFYPSATNFEGRKVMVFNAPGEVVERATFLDPHFCDNSKHLSPFARFAPTEAGWAMAVRCAELAAS